MMASARVKSPSPTEPCFIDRSYAWLSPRAASPPSPDQDFLDFEFRLGDGPVAMLPADELFSDGKLVPLHLAAARLSATPEIRSPDPVRSRRRVVEICGSDPYLLSPRAPRCTTGWRELLGLKRQQTANTPEAQKPSAGDGGGGGGSAAARSLKLHFLHRNAPKSASVDSSLSLPLLRDSDPDLLSLSSRRSLSTSSSSSSVGDHDDLPRMSLDAEKAGKRNPLRMPAARSAPAVRGASVDSPRMNASGRVVFEGLERSSSSPGSFTRPRPRGVERSYSANVRVTHLLNVPVCSLRGPGRSVFGQLFSPQKKESPAARSSAAAGGGYANGRIKMQRTSRDN